MIYKYYTDGAATMKKDSNGNYLRETGGWAFAQIKDNKVIFAKAGHKNNASNNEMELMAILEALNHYLTHYYSNDINDIVEIYSDSAYCINIYTQWAKNWETNTIPWTRGKNKPIENLEIIKTTWELIKKLNEGFREIKFIKVIGHSNDYFNDYVDGLAVSAKGGMKWPNKAATNKEAVIQ